MSEMNAAQAQTIAAALATAGVPGEVLDGLSLSAFVGKDGAVDQDKVARLGRRFTGVEPRRRNFGAGGVDNYPGPRSQGSDEAARRFGTREEPPNDSHEQTESAAQRAVRRRADAVKRAREHREQRARVNGEQA